MSGLLGLLDLGNTALIAQDAAIATSGRNTANVNTAGYSRESVDLQSQLAAPLVGGVTVGDVTRADDQLLAANERNTAGSQGYSDSMVPALTDLESQLAPSTGGLIPAISGFFSGLVSLSGSPLDPAARQSAVANAQSLATAFNQAAAAVSQAQSDSDGRIASLATQATNLAAQIAQANRALAVSNDPVLADKRDLAAKQLAAIVGGAARIDSDGKMRFVTTGGVVLVDGDRAAQVTTSPSATYGNHLQINIVDGVHTQDVTKMLDGGQLAGEIAFRDGTAVQAGTNLDNLAFALETQINNVHQAGAALDGSSGRPLFNQPASAAGAAAAFSVNSAIVANPSLLATAAVGAGSGDTTNLMTLIGLKDQLLAGGGTRTFSDEAINTVGQVGSAAASAKQNQDMATARANVLAAARDSVSGVSTSDELNKLSQYQNAANAARRFVTTVNDLLNNLINNM
jgi:flagellar hook-associated protein 1 FlgK